MAALAQEYNQGEARWMDVETVEMAGEIQLAGGKKWHDSSMKRRNFGAR